MTKSGFLINADPTQFRFLINDSPVWAAVLNPEGLIIASFMLILKTVEDKPREIWIQYNVKMNTPYKLNLSGSKNNKYKLCLQYSLTGMDISHSKNFKIVLALIQSDKQPLRKDFEDKTKATYFDFIGELPPQGVAKDYSDCFALVGV